MEPISQTQGTPDCRMLFDAHRGKIDITQLTEHFDELLLYEVAET
jgi:hypothetical protein